MKRQVPAFTLLEMIVVLAIAALIIGIGAGAVRQAGEEHELSRMARSAERVVMQAMTRVISTTQTQNVNLETLNHSADFTIRRAGANEFKSADGERLILRPGGLCEPLTMRWQHGDAWVAATLDPLTGAFADLEEHR